MTYIFHIYFVYVTFLIKVSISYSIMFLCFDYNIQYRYTNKSSESVSAWNVIAMNLRIFYRKDLY